MSGFTCSVCEEKCTLSFIRINKSYFHRDCFQCSLCKCDLQTTGYYKSDGIYYCPQDFVQTYGGCCGACNLPIRGDRVAAINQNFHKKCFHCCLCRSTFQVSSRVVFAGRKFYCDSCSIRSGKKNKNARQALNEAPIQNTLSLPEEKELDVDAFQKELSQRLAVQYELYEPHIVGGEIESIAISQKDEDNTKKCEKSPPFARPRKKRLQPVTERERVDVHKVMTQMKSTSFGNAKGDKILSSENEAKNKRHVSALVKAFENAAENDGKLSNISISSSDYDLLGALIEGDVDNQCQLLPASSSKLSNSSSDLFDVVACNQEGCADLSGIDSLNFEPIYEEVDLHQISTSRDGILGTSDKQTRITTKLEEEIFSVNDNYNEEDSTRAKLRSNCPKIDGKLIITQENLPRNFSSLKYLLSAGLSISLLFNLSTFIYNARRTQEHSIFQNFVEEENLIEYMKNISNALFIKVFTV